MATVVRVKRRCEDEPIEAFILNCKRRKISDGSIIDPLATTVFKFAGTLEKDEDIVSHLDTAKYAEDTQKVKHNMKSHIVSINDKLRSEHKEISKKNRYKIVNRFRSQVENNIEANEGLDKSVTVLDLENDLEGNGDEQIHSGENDNQKYVYDLYYNHSSEIEKEEIEDYVSAHPIYDYHSVSSLADKDESVSDDESEDSNAEDNWRNDYPDESDVESIDENDMMHAMKNIDLDDSQSDDEEDEFLYDHDDVRRHGKHFARFKAEYNEEVISDSDEISE